MNFPQNLSDMDYRINQKMTSSKNSANQDIFKVASSNQMAINFSKDESNSNSIDLKNNKINNLKQKAYISTYDNENENEKENEEVEEEEINSDEYVSSTMLDVDTNTYINMTNNTVVTNKEDKNSKASNKNKNSTFTQGKLKVKENDNNLNDILLNNIQTIESEKEYEIKKNTNDNIAIKTNKTNYKKTNSNNSNDNNNNNEVKKVHHHNNKSDYFINNRPSSITKDKKNNSNNSNSKEDKKGIFTPNNDSKKKFKILRDMIFKKLDQYQNKNIYNVGQSNTINIIENIEDNKNDNDNENDNNIISINNDIIKVDMGVNKSKRNKTSRMTNNNSISVISNNSNKNISVKAGQYQNINENNNNNNKKKNKINIYSKNIIKEIDTINIEDQKYEMIPQSMKKIKTQGRIGKIVYSNQNKKNNFIYISNNSNNSNINSNRNFNSPLIKKNNRISPQNCINNVEYFNSICTHKNKKMDENNYLKHSNIHSLKNLKSESLQKSIKKYLLEDEYLSVFPLGNDKQKMKILKDSKNKKAVKYQNIKYNEDKYKKINNNNIANRKQIKSGNSAYAKNFMNNYQNEHILNTISNHNKKVELYGNIKNNNNLVQNKNSNISNKRISNEKNNKNRELSFNLQQDNNSSIKDLLSLKKIKNIKNKFILQSPDLNMENGGRNTNNYPTKKNNPLTTRIKLDIMAEENKNNIRKNQTKYIVNTSNSNANKKNKNNSNSRKRIIYIENNNLKNMNPKSLLYNSLSPNCQSIKQLVDKNKINNIKEMYGNINYNNQGRNTYNIYSSSKNNYNTNNISNINNNINININSNKAFYKKIQRDNIKDKRSIGENTINYNDNMSEYQKSNLSANNKKIIIFNNVSNYNINHTENILNNIDSIRNDPNNGYKKTIEILSPFASINNKNNQHKKFYVNKQNTNSQKIINSKIYSRDSKDKKNNITLIEQKNIYLDNSKNKNNHNYHHIYNGNNSSNNSNSNKYLYNKNANQKLNKNENLNIHYGHTRVNSSQYNGINKINNNISNNFTHCSNSNDKERNTITNKSYGNLNLSKRAKDKNIANEIFEKIHKNYTKKSMSPIQK